MTTGITPVAGWATEFIAWMHPAAVILAIALPLFTATVRRISGHTPCFNVTYAFHDVASGFTLPSFAALALSGLAPDIANHVDGHGAFLAGALGIIYTIASMFKGHAAISNGNGNGNNGVGDSRL